MIKQKFVKEFSVAPGSKVDLKKFTTDWAGTEEAKKLGSGEKVKQRALKILEKNREELAKVQELIYANNTRSVLLIFQAMDAAGKDGTISHVMSGVNPQGCQVFSFKKPSAEELDHNFLWRYMKALPERGRIGIFNRSYYEDVLVVKVHPEWLDQTRAKGKSDKDFWRERYEDINNFERHLTRNGTLILKFFLHLSKSEQKRRFLERLTNSDKYWKVSPSDMGERKFWREYQGAFESALSATSTKWAPWYVIPADRKYVARALVADIVVAAINGLDLKYPTVSPEAMKALVAARKELEGDGKKPKARKRKRSPACRMSSFTRSLLPATIAAMIGWTPLARPLLLPPAGEGVGLVTSLCPSSQPPPLPGWAAVDVLGKVNVGIAGCSNSSVEHFDSWSWKLADNLAVQLDPPFCIVRGRLLKEKCDARLAALVAN
jgi:PPK2 family polyphosphate:nucleotide phosphotransferase